MNKKNSFLIVAFLLIISSPTLDSIFGLACVDELFEKRLPIAMPSYPKKFNQLKLYFTDLGKYFDDHYGFRKTLINFNSKIMDKIFDESPSSRALIGKDGWMFFDNNNSLVDVTGKIILPRELIAKGVKSFNKNLEFLKKNNIEYLVIIAPDKSSIYTEYLPDYISYNRIKNHRIDQFLDALLKSNPQFPIIDLRDELQNAQKKEIVYHKTDTHWNKRGAHYGYLKIMNYLAKKNIKFKPKNRHEFIDKQDEYIRGDISDIMALNTTNLNYDLQPKFKINTKIIEPSKDEKLKFHNPFFLENTNKNLPILFAYKDSFFADLFLFIGEHFSTIYSANESPCDIEYSRISNYNPNVVIHEFWEGRIEIILNRCKN